MIAQDKEVFKNIDEGFFSSLEKQLEKARQSTQGDLLFESPWQLVKKQGLPTRKNEDYKYIQLKPLIKTVQASQRSSSTYSSDEVNNLIDQYLNQYSSESCIVYMDGSFNSEYSRLSAIENEGVEVLPMTEAATDYSAFVRKRWTELLSIEKDLFYLLAMANASQGAFVYIPQKTVCKKPLLTIHFSSSSQSALSLPFMQVYTAKESSIQIIEVNAMKGKVQLAKGIDVICDQAAHAQLLISPTDDSIENLFYGVRASVKQDASFKSSYLSTGAKLQRYDYHILLQGENGSADLRGVNCLKDENQCHGRVLIEHQSPLCHSNQYFRSVLDDRSKSSFNGKIYVHQIAQKTEAYQLDQKIVLNDKAQAYTKPNLEIFADDVKASHGATIGKLDEEQIFYMRTRGLSVDKARSVLLKGFAEEVFEELSSDKLRDQYNQAIEKYLQR